MRRQTMMVSLGVIAGLGFACGSPAADGVDPSQECALVQLSLDGPELPPFEFRAIHLVWTGDTSVAVSDPDDKQLVVLSLPTGRELIRVGREGGGAGEFRAVGAGSATNDGFLVTGYSRISRFDGRGEERGTVTVPGMITGLLGWERGRATVLWAVPMGRPTVGHADPLTGEWEAAFAPFALDPELNVELFAGVPNPFVASAGARNGDVVVGQQLTYRLTRFTRDGQIVRTFGRPDLERTGRTEQEREALANRLKQGLQEAAPQLDPADLAIVDQGVNLPRPHFESLRFAPDGRLWVITTRRAGDSTALDVFLPNGQFAQTITVAHRVLDVAFRGPRIAVLRELQAGPAEGQAQVVVGVIRGGACG